MDESSVERGAVTGRPARRATVAAWVERKECSIETAARVQGWRTDEAQGGQREVLQISRSTQTTGRGGAGWGSGGGHGRENGEGQVIREQVLMCSL